MNWDDLRFILAIVREGSLLGAAKRLSVTHTTVGRRLRLCEEGLGVALFDRTPEGLVPTSAGQQLYELAEVTEEQVMMAEAQLLGTDLRLEGTLRVTTFDPLYALCHSAFFDFYKRYPDIELTLTTPSRTVSLSRREADVALRLTYEPPPGLVGRRIGNLHFGIYASPKLVKEVGKNKGVSEFPWIGSDLQLPDAAQLEALVASLGCKTTIRTDENPLVVRKLLQAGAGATYLPIPEGESLGLVRIDKGETQSVPVWLLTLSDLRRNSRVRAFMDHMGERLPKMLSEFEKQI